MLQILATLHWSTIWMVIVLQVFCFLFFSLIIAFHGRMSHGFYYRVAKFLWFHNKYGSGGSIIKIWSLWWSYNSRMMAEVFMHSIVKLHGMLESIVLDRDKIFTHQFWQYLFNTSLVMSSAYHPQFDGQSEVLNKCLEIYLRCFTFYNPKN